MERDADQLDHTLHRQYSSSFGRWMSPDPGGVKVVNMDTPQTWNMYAYVADNPTTDTDPTGLSSQYNTNGGCATLRNCTDDRQSLDHPPGQELNTGVGTNQANMLTATVQGTQVTVAAQSTNSTGNSTTARANSAAITQALKKTPLANGATGWSEVQSSSMRPGGTEMNVVWKPGAAAAFKKAGFHVIHDPLHHGESLRPKGWHVRNLHLIFPQRRGDESQVHIDYRGGPAHFFPRNDNVLYNDEQYRKWYGPLP